MVEYCVILKSFEFLEEFVIKEIKSILNIEFSQLDSDTFEVVFSDFDSFYLGVYDLIYFSRCFDGIYLRRTIDESENGKMGEGKEFSVLERVEIDISNEPEIVYDLVGDVFEDRSYKINEDDSFLPHFLVVFCLYKLGIDEENKFSMIDPMAEMGDIIIEASLFNERKALFVQERNKLPIYEEFKRMPKMALPSKDKNKFIALVSDDVQFKYLRENVNASGQKIKVSKYEMDWLDVKFKKDDVDFGISFLPDFEDEAERDEFLKEFFYQLEFVCSKKICLISMEDLGDMIALGGKKVGLEMISSDKVELFEEEFFVYVFS